MQVAARINGELRYLNYLGIVSLKRFTPKITLLCHKASGKYFEALKKMKGFIFIEDDVDKPLTPGDAYIVQTNSLTLGRWIDLPKKDVVLEDGALVFTGEGDIFPVKTISHIANIPEVEISPSIISDGELIYSQLVMQILPERVWNYYNDTIWGYHQEKPMRVKKMDKKFRFHILGLNHLPTSERYMACAFTQKNVKMCKMLMDLGHEVYLYGAEGSDAPCTKFIQTHTLKQIREAWGEGDNRFEIGYDWHKKQFKHDINKDPALVTQMARAVAIEEIKKNSKPDDFLLVTQGYYQKPIADAVGLFLTVEPGIGYRGSYAEFRSFESTYIQNFTSGS